MHWSFNNANNAFHTALNEDKYFNDPTWNVVYVDSHDYAPDQCQTVRYNAAQMHGPKTFLSCSHSGEFRVSTTAAR